MATAVHTVRTDAGFTLIEIMVVVMILGLLAALVVPNVTQAADTAREQTARSNVTSIAQAVKGYRAANGRLPESLQVLLQPDAHGHCTIEDLPADPWGQPYAMRATDTPPGWEVVSFGADHEENTPDDISSRRPAE